MKTEHRPVSLPDRGTDGAPSKPKARAASRDDNGELILPQGATMFAWRYLQDGRMHKAPLPVPVNDGAQVTHREWLCQRCPGSLQWLAAGIKTVPVCPVHRRKLRMVKRSDVEVGVKPAAETASASAAIAWGDHQERLVVAAATLGVGVTGAVLDVGDFPWWGEVAQFAAVPACVAGSWWLTRAWLVRNAEKGDFSPADEVAGKRARRRIDRRARTAAYVTAAAGVWVELADAINIDQGGAAGGLGIAALLGLGVLGSRPYLRWVDDRRRRKAVTPTAETSTEEPVDDTPQPTREEELRAYVLERWVKVSARGRVLHGTQLEEIRGTVGGWSAVIVADEDSDLDPEKFDLPEPVRKIARAYSVGTSMVSIIADPFDANRAMILVQRHSPLQDGRRWDGGGIDPDGVAETMTMEDGSRGRHPFWRQGWGAVMELIAGCTGSGKSEYLNLLLALERKSGRVVSWVGDPQMGQSLGDIRDGVDWFAPTTEEILIMLRCAVMVMLARNVLVTRMRVTETRPNGKVVQRRVKYVEVSPDFPLLSITIDEAHLPMNDPEHGKEIVKLLALLSKSGRKANVKIRLLVQSPLLSELKDSVLRSQLASGLVTVFRTADRLTGQAAWPGGKMPGDPSALPREWEDGSTTAGLGYSSGSARMRMRTDLAADIYDLMTEGKPLGLESGVLHVAGVAYADRRKRLDAFDNMDPSEILGAGIPEGMFGPGDADVDERRPAGGREAILRFFASRWLDGDRDPVQFGDLAASVRDVIKTRACTNACNQLVADQILATSDGGYWLTEAGAEQIGVLEEALV